MIFIDGLGLGPPDAQINPLARASMPSIGRLLDGMDLTVEGVPAPGTTLAVTAQATLLALDARLGIKGLPQSATGQTTLLTGVNGSKALGRHVSGAPTPTLAKILRSHSIFKQLRQARLAGTFANPFTEQYFEAVDAGRMRLSATTTAMLSGGLKPRMLDHLLAGRAVFHDMTGAGLRERGHRVPLVTPAEAGRRLAALAREHDFTLFEHFLTDMAGHAQDMAMAVGLLEQLDEFIGSVAAHVDFDDTLLFVVSDHGNVEDLSVKTHTFNPVPALLVGAGKDELAPRLQSLTDVTPAVVDYLVRRRRPASDGPPDGQRTLGRAAGTDDTTGGGRGE